MPRPRDLVPFLLPWLAAAGPLPETANLIPTTDATTHANHIFNALHSSMRQFGSSLNHNGMSLFIATVPEGTEFYHGTSQKDRINGTQWLAFEPEHALLFARGHRGPPPGHGPPGDGHAPPDIEHEKPKGPYFPDEGIDQSNPTENKDHDKYKSPKDGSKHHDGKDRKGRPGKHHSDKGCHGPSRNESRPDAPHHPPPPPHHGPPPHHHDGPPSPPHRCPPGEGHLPCEPSEGHRGPPHRGPPSKHHGYPPAWFGHHDDHEHHEHHDDHEHHGDHGDDEHHEHHGPPPHMFFDELNEHHHDDEKHRSVFSLPPIGFWAHRLGDLLRNPKKRHTPPPARPTTSVIPSSPEFIETRAEQEPLVSDDPKPKEDNSGYLHTYRTKHNLRLLYVDGQSAAKSKKGTLDTQDVLLLDDSIDHGSGMFGEMERAKQMCKMAHEQWNDRIDGILRMEGGFEIILCDFAAHLNVVNIVKTNPESRGGGLGGGADNGDGFSYYRAVAARYHGIGGGRVELDYENFVSAFAYPEAIYFDDTGRPRLNNASGAIDDVRRAVDKMVLRKNDDFETVNWQVVADMVVARYSDRIEYLASGSLSTLSSLQAEVGRAIRPFIDYSARNSSAEIDRCASQFVPGTQALTSTSVASQAIREVTNTLCSSLVSAFAQTDHAAMLDQIKELKEYLAWTTWKQCRGCAADEVCFLPIWPTGTAEDFVQPKCRSNVKMGPGHGSENRYWNDFGRPMSKKSKSLEA